jgi:hypothetical protein
VIQDDDPRFDAIRRALEQAADTPAPDFAPLRAVIADDDRRLRFLRAAATACAALPIVAWLASVTLHPIHPTVCSDFEPRDVLSIGVVPAVAWCASAALVWRDAPWAQLLVRAVWWSLHVTGLVLTWTRPGLLPYGFPAAAIGGGAALLILGGRGVAPFELEGPLRPRRHTREVVLLSVLGGADLLTLVAANVANTWVHPLGAALVAALLPAVVGVMMLRRWAPHATMAANALLLLALTHPLAVGVPASLGALLALSAAAQLAASALILRSLASGLEADLPARQPWVDRVLSGVVLLAILAAIAGGVRPIPAGQLAASCAESRGPSPEVAP